jgi:TrmH family RNA methyltransferase
MAHVLEVTSLANPRIKDIAALAMKKTRVETGLFMVEGLQLVGFGVEAGWELDTLVVGSQFYNEPEILHRAMAVAGHVLKVSEPVLEKLSRKDNPQAVLGVFKQRKLNLGDLKPAQKDVWVVLEQVRDPGNLGTIIRTVDAVGAAGVVLLGDCTDLWAPECVRATMGSVFHVPVVAGKVADFLVWRETFDGLLAGTHLRGDTDYRKLPSTRPLLLCMGTEQSGLSEELAGACDVLTKIAMRGRAESLNLAMATGVMLYEVFRS